MPAFCCTYCKTCCIRLDLPNLDWPSDAASVALAEHSISTMMMPLASAVNSADCHKSLGWADCLSVLVCDLLQVSEPDIEAARLGAERYILMHTCGVSTSTLLAFAKMLVSILNKAFLSASLSGRAFPRANDIFLSWNFLQQHSCLTCMPPC